AVGVRGQSSLSVDSGVSELVTGGRQRPQADVRREVAVRVEVDRPAQGSLGLRVVGRIDRHATLLDVGSTQVGPGAPVPVVALELALGRADGGGQRVTGCGEPRLRAGAGARMAKRLGRLR